VSDLENTMFSCLTCNKVVDEVVIDGGALIDRYFDTIGFVLKIVDGKPKFDRYDGNYTEYMSDYNESKFQKMAEDVALKSDLLSCVVCGDDVPVWEANYD